MTTEGMHVSHPHRTRSALLTAAAAFAVAGPLISAPPASAATPTVAEVSPHAAQTIDNIGASGAWWVNDLKNFDPRVQARVSKLLFSKDGLALSSYRYNIGGGGTGVTYAPRAPETFVNGDGSYDWSKDKAGRTFLYAAAKYGVKDLIAFVNSAPAQWKTNGLSCGGYLKTENEQDYAKYVADVTDHFAKQGVRFDYISPFNEPTNSFGDCGRGHAGAGRPTRRHRAGVGRRAADPRSEDRHHRGRVQLHGEFQHRGPAVDLAAGHRPVRRQARPPHVQQPGRRPAGEDLRDVQVGRQAVLVHGDLLLRQRRHGLGPGVRPHDRRWSEPLPDHLQGLRDRARLGVPVVGRPVGADRLRPSRRTPRAGTTA